jgi:two-component system CheB/CheR fusion protein
MTDGQPAGDRAPNAGLDSSQQHASTPLDAFPVVGIGASAGGLAAFEAFFSGMPTDAELGMAFVLVQHLAPDHKSILCELIRRYTRMPVSEVEDGMLVQVNCVYVIPPNYDMALLRGVLHLLDPAAPRGQRMPIDYFFASLAHDRDENAVGIVLSGTGSNGTLEVQAIKNAGGMVMAQSTASSEFDGMRQSAIATGQVDYQLPPAEMSAQIMAYVARTVGTLTLDTGSVSAKSGIALKKAFVLLRAQTLADQQNQLRDANQSLEQRVRELTHELEQACNVAELPSEQEASF